MTKNNFGSRRCESVHDGFFRYLEQFGQLELAAAASLSKEVRVFEKKRRTILLDQNEICKDLFYIHKGAASLAVVAGSKQAVTWISMDGDIITNPESSRKPTSGYIIELIEDSSYLSLSFSAISRLCRQHPSFGGLIQRLSFYQLGIMQERVNRSQTLSAAEHYSWIRETHPEAERRLPLNVIASYLGINQASLSRLRKQEVSL